MGLFFDTVTPAVGHVLLVILQVVSGLMLTSAMLVVYQTMTENTPGSPEVVDPASVVRSAAEKSDDNNKKKETLSGVETATTTTTSAQKLVNEAQPEIPEPKGPRELQQDERYKFLLEWEQRLSRAENELDRKEAANDRIRKQLERRQLNEAHDTHVWVDRQRQDALLARLAKLEQDLEVAVDRNSVYERQMTAERLNSFNAKVKKVGKEKRQRDRHLVRKANEKKGAAAFKVKKLESQLETARKAISDLSEEARIAKEQCEQLKGAWEEHCQAAAERRWKWATEPDKDKDIPIRSYSLEADAEVLLTGALIEIGERKVEEYRKRCCNGRTRERFRAEIQNLRRQKLIQRDGFWKEIRELKQALDAATIDNI